MVKKRVHELAKELNIESKEIIKQLSNIGVNVKSHMSTLEDTEIERLLRSLKKVPDEKVKKPVEKADTSVTVKKDAASLPAAEDRERQLEKKKETSAPEIKKQQERDKNAQFEHRKEGQVPKKDFHRGPGMVDRVPSRPPDRRFQEKPRHDEKSKPWGQPKSDQVFRNKEVPQERIRPDRSQQQESQGDDRIQQLKPQREHLHQEKSQKDDRSKYERPKQSGQQRETSQQPRKQQERKFPQERSHQGQVPGRHDVRAKRHPVQQQEMHPRPSSVEKGHVPAARTRTDDRGFHQGGPQGTKTRPSDRAPFTGTGPGARPKSAQSALWAKIHPEDRDRFFGDKAKPPERQKQFIKTPPPKPATKGRADKREVIAEIAEEKLRPRTAAGGPRRKNIARQHDSVQRPAQPVEKKPIVLGESVTVQELAVKMYRTPAEIIKKLMQLGVLATINQEIDIDTASILANEFGYEVEIKLPVDLEAVLMQEPEEDKKDLEHRPCVVTVMGHVDHGKTSLLDAIRETNVTATEAGGITQHIGAYQIEHNGKKITFVDTPGHEAFTAMRARGAQVTDIAVLVVAADDGVMPQTVEAINHAKDARVPIIVAINKIDKPGANIDRVKQQLTEHGLVAEEWGGDTICVNVSAVKREGMSELLEMILLVAEMSELKANPNRPARGTVIEAELDKGRGPVATVLVQKGTLNIGDTIIAGAAFGRVRAMMDDKGRRIKKAGPSTPVEVLGFSEVPQAGDIFIVVEDEKLARTIASRRQTRKREEELKTGSRVSLEDLFNHIKEGRIKELGIIIKGDVQGSVEALRQALVRLNTGEVKVNIIHGGVGAITETDIMLASASNAIVIGFNVRPDVNARKAAENEKVDVRLYRVIYDAIEDVKAAMSGLLEPEYREVLLGRTEIRKIFRASKIGTIAGCYVLEGKIEKDAGIRVVRDGIVVYEGKLESLKRFKDDVKEVVQGYECGLTLEKFSEIQEGDIIEAFSIEAIKRQLS